MIVNSFFRSARSVASLGKGFTSDLGGRRLASTAVLPELPYEYSALEPVISGEIMEIHHSKHHKAYVTNFNAALEKYEEAEKCEDFSAQISLQSALKFNGGGHINHSIFWKNLAPISQGGGELPTGSLASKIESDFGSVDKLIAEMNAAGTAVQGSGWVWLGLNKGKDRLAVQTTANQDPLVTTGLVPLLGIDVWEHAYYLQYKNVRPDYLKNIWKVVNWKDVGERYESSKK
uniref:Superoxide dismutase n=1 Tax=Spirogyra sp. KG0101 TaxID=180961 RepID=K7ZR52_9VIRI|nr:mitochondrial Mn-superoxide dismutase-1 [Spirogyra sp. KG0101]BAM68577.1 mitochondrial Mn-superoxide dismutase-1 [Spirogyra sp. KG0101]